MSGQQYRVVGGVVNVPTVHAIGLGAAGRGGRSWVQLIQGSLLPPDVSQDRIDHLLSVKLIEPVPAEAA